MQFVKGDRVAYLAETTNGTEALCGTVVDAKTFTDKGWVLTVNKSDGLLVHEDSGILRVIDPSKVDYFDVYTGRKKRKYTQSDEIIKLKEKAQEVDKQFAQLTALNVDI